MKPLLGLVLAAMVAVAAPRVFGTAQVPDKLILDGKEVPLFANPLEYHEQSVAQNHLASAKRWFSLEE